MSTRSLYIHLQYTTESTTLEERVNASCFVLGVYGFDHASCFIRYARADGALTFAHYTFPKCELINKQKKTLLRVSLIPQHIYVGITRRFPRDVSERILDYVAVAS